MDEDSDEPEEVIEEVIEDGDYTSDEEEEEPAREGVHYEFNVPYIYESGEELGSINHEDVTITDFDPEIDTITITTSGQVFSEDYEAHIHGYDNEHATLILEYSPGDYFFEGVDYNHHSYTRAEMRITIEGIGTVATIEDAITYERPDTPLFNSSTPTTIDEDDFLVGGRAANTINGGDGDDTLYGHYHLGEGAFGSDHPDTNVLNPFIHDEDQDILNGGAGDDTLIGSDDDILNGDDGDDVLIATGAQTLTGGGGDDTFHLDEVTYDVMSDEAFYHDLFRYVELDDTSDIEDVPVITDFDADDDRIVVQLEPIDFDGYSGSIQYGTDVPVRDYPLPDYLSFSDEDNPHISVPYPTEIILDASALSFTEVDGNTEVRLGDDLLATLTSPPEISAENFEFNLDVERFHSDFFIGEHDGDGCAANWGQLPVVIEFTGTDGDDILTADGEVRLMGGAGADTFVVNDVATYSDLMSGNVEAAPAIIADYNLNGEDGDGSDTIVINIALPSVLDDTIQETVQSDGHIAQDADGNFILNADAVTFDVAYGDTFIKLDGHTIAYVQGRADIGFDDVTFNGVQTHFTTGGDDVGVDDAPVALTIMTADEIAANTIPLPDDATTILAGDRFGGSAGTTGSDIIYGTAGPDALGGYNDGDNWASYHGDGQTDYIFAGDDFDQIFGADDDVLVGGGGYNAFSVTGGQTIYAGSGVDEIAFSQSDYGDRNTNGSDGGVTIVDFDGSIDTLSVRTDAVVALDASVDRDAIGIDETLTVSNDVATITYSYFVPASGTTDPYIVTDVVLNPDAITTEEIDGQTVVSVGDAEVAILVNPTNFDPSAIAHGRF